MSSIVFKKCLLFAVPIFVTVLVALRFTDKPFKPDGLMFLITALLIFAGPALSEIGQVSGAIHRLIIHSVLIIWLGHQRDVENCALNVLGFFGVFFELKKETSNGTHWHRRSEFARKDKIIARLWAAVIVLALLLLLAIVVIVYQESDCVEPELKLRQMVCKEDGSVPVRFEDFFGGLERQYRKKKLAQCTEYDLGWLTRAQIRSQFGKTFAGKVLSQRSSIPLPVEPSLSTESGFRAVIVDDRDFDLH